MFGRKEELKTLETLYNSNKFEFLVLYGRRRVGKTTLLTEFAKKNSSMYFVAQEKNNSLNMADFLEAMKTYFKFDYAPSFNDWSELFKFLIQKVDERLKEKPNEKVCLIIDEFPFIAKEYATIKSILQHTIDQVWQNKNVMLVLCGSSVSFMVNEVLGHSSPLYGRRTANIELLPFDYTITNDFFPKFSNLDKITAYCILGGIPYYLQTFNDKLSLKENIKNSIVAPYSLLHEEPQFLLKQEFRELTIYNSILEAIANGSSKFNEISTKIHEETSKCSSYIKNLQEIRVVKKQLPYGEIDTGKKSIYSLTDNYFKFWYRFIFSNSSKITMLGAEKYTNEIIKDMPSVLGSAFEEVCTQYLMNLGKKDKLPFIPKGFGRWWGNNPKTKRQDDIDIMGVDKNRGIFCECKFRNEKFDLQEFNDLISASNIFTQITEKYYYIFVKSGYTSTVVEESKKYNVKLLTIDDLFENE